MSNYRRRLLLTNQTEEKNLYLYGNSVQEGTPTPDAPIEIMSIENPTIKVMGNNLIKITRDKEVNSIYGYQALVNDDMSITINGGPVTQEVYPVLCNNITLKAGTYTISGGMGGSNKTWQLYLYLPNTTQKYYFASYDKDSGYTFTLKEEQSGEVILLLRKDATFDNLTIYPMLNEGTVTLPYEPFYEELITIDKTTPFGKNLIPTYTGADYQSSLYTCTHNGDGTFVINGTGNGSSYATCCTLVGSSLNDLLVNGETYTFSLNCSDTTTTSACLVIRYREISTGTDRWYSNNLSKCTRFTVNKDKYNYAQLYIQINPNTQIFTNVIVKPMLTRGYFNELPFEPYVPPVTTMRGIKDYKDRIYTKDGKVWFEQNIFNYIPTKAYTVTANKASADMFPTLGSKYKPLGLNGNYMQTPSNAMNNAFKYNVSYAITSEPHWFIGYDSSYNKTSITLVRPTGSNGWNSTDDAWQWLINTLGDVKWEIQYVLANPVITEITGALAEKILAIDKTKNIYFISENGIQGETEVIEE